MHWHPPPFLALLVGLLSLAASFVIAADPKVSVTRFKNVPSKIEYFEDTTVSPEFGCLRSIPPDLVDTRCREHKADRK
jgi:hypothetical protein